MAITPLPITNGFYLSDSMPVSAQQCTNLYVNVVQSQALAQETLFGTPGIAQLATSGEVQNANRGAHVMDGVPYFVNGQAIYRLNSDNSLTSLGAIPTTARVSMADNGSQLFILVPGVDGYIYTASTGVLAIIADADFKANGLPQSVVFLDGYFVVTTDSKKFIISALNDGTSYNALDFGTAEADPDYITAPLVFKNQLFIGGASTCEAFQNVGGSGFPFRRSGLYLDKGISATFSVVNANDTFMFVGAGKNESPAIWSFTGNTVQKVSTTAIDTLLHALTGAEVASITAWAYAQKGAYFVGFNLPSTTIVIDTITGRWHERKSAITNAVGGVSLSRFRANSIVQAYGKIIVGDNVDGRIGDLNTDVYTEYGANIRRIVSTQPFQNNMQSFKLPTLELTVESGVGNSADNDPQIGLSISKDGGKTYADERLRSMGRIGEYTRRAIWRRNGRIPRFSVFKFTISAPVKVVIIQLTADIRG
jgi:hypothetical protein